jgi:uncharacterized SAM-binding protein YcdF (DUF218 family)
MKKLPQKISTIVLWLLFAVSAVLLLATFTNLNLLIVKPLVRDETPKKADVIIVLGGGLIRDTRSLPWGVEERIQKGVDLYKQGFAPKMEVTGGLAWHNGIAESEVMAPYAVSLGVARQDITEENLAKDTHTNAVYSQALMSNHGWRTALIVTSDFHTQRACHVFRQQQISVTCVAAYKNPAFKGDAFRNLLDFQAIVREYAATVYYWVRGYI